MIVEAPFVDLVNGIRDKLPVAKNGYIFLGEGPVPSGYTAYEEWLTGSSAEEPDDTVDAADPWTFMTPQGPPDGLKEWSGPTRVIWPNITWTLSIWAYAQPIR